MSDEAHIGVARLLKIMRLLKILVPQMIFFLLFIGSI